MDKSLDQIAIEEASKDLSKGRFSWQAYLVLCAAENRMNRNNSSVASEATETMTDGVSDFALMARDYIATGDGDRLRECIGTAQATISELHAASSGEQRRAIEDWARSLGEVL